MSIFYVYKVELYAGLPQDLSSLPPFLFRSKFLGALDLGTHHSSAQFQDVNHAKREMIVEEAEEIEQEAYIMTKPNREVTFQKKQARKPRSYASSKLCRLTDGGEV